MEAAVILEKIYAGFLGMNIGIRLGAPVEPLLWTSDRIERFYGDIKSYVKEFKNFAADDDVNGPVFFLRALSDGALGRDLTPGDVSEAWLNYAREGMGMFWWGGYGVSTEHTAYLNLKNGIPAPASGSCKTNGKILAEQIGGQIFIDTWGFVHPGNSEKAASEARIAASVSHDGEGLHGASFIAACISQAFLTDSVEDLVTVGLSTIPSDSTYAQVVKAVQIFHGEHPENWRSCLAYLQGNWGYDRYPGVCHIIPNAGVCVMALLYGRTFARAIEIATMAGWDTDCNAGNVGSILGVAGDLASIPSHYRQPVNDMIVLSGISGYLNILDVPTYAKQLCSLALQCEHQMIPRELQIREGSLDFDFSLPGSTHGFRLSNTFSCRMRNNATAGVKGDGALEVMYDQMVRPQGCRIFYKPFYRREDFDDERYMPVFSPTVYPGQTVSIRVRLEKISGESIALSPYVRNSVTKKIITFGAEIVKDEAWRDISFVIDGENPSLKGAMIDEVGLLFESNSPAKNSDFGCLYIDRFSVGGKPDYYIDLKQQAKEFASITPFSHNHGSWDLVEGRMEAMVLDHGEAMTGNYFARDCVFKGTVCPHTGSSHLVSLRVQGARRGYYAGFHNGEVGIFKHDKESFVPLVSKKYELVREKEYALIFSALGNALSLEIDGSIIISCSDDSFAYGMCGYAMYATGRCGFGNVWVQEE
ncbi:ADP-ribosylglycohydrolase family protein [uncultured Sphaerochaeta sp.]|uniref:ADP-ribosylglycohydrolase family protein n=1 Tax=uncultured Sphaerochaeta sp. TaxID=886478 RepID=UPI002A0A2C06|nr:ADP-ribosylglycohydrolase family protein [uncultured Sphaerochaeta sp.]